MQWTSEPPWQVPAQYPVGDAMKVMIPSSVIRQELRKANRELTDLERAVLMERSRVPWQEKLAWLAALRDRTSDETLRQQLQKLIASRLASLLTFLDDDNSRAVYRAACVTSDGSAKVGALFRTAEDAWRDLTQEENCEAEKSRIDRLPLLGAGEEPAGTISMMLGTDGSFLSLRGTSEDDDWTSYTRANFAELPHPFRRGDIVCTADDKLHGVVETASAYRSGAEIRWPPSQWNERQEPFRVAMFNVETGLFRATAEIQPVELEFYPAMKRDSFATMDGLLGILSDLYLGRGEMQRLSLYTSMYREAQGYED